jgi:hypothetical protein
MMYKTIRVPDTQVAILAALLAGGVLAAPSALAQSDNTTATQEATQAPAAAVRATALPQVHKVSQFHPVSVSNRAKTYYEAAWGVDNLLVRRTASGNLIRFSYRVTDPVRAKALGDNHATPYLYGQRSHAVLHIPVMDKIGQLRQTGAADTGKEYWMVFSNKGDLVKSGDRVSVIIGTFHADGMMVE